MVDDFGILVQIKYDLEGKLLGEPTVVRQSPQMDNWTKEQIKVFGVMAMHTPSHISMEDILGNYVLDRPVLMRYSVEGYIIKSVLYRKA